MTITLTREEAQQVLYVIQYLAVPDRHNIEDKSDAIRLVAETLRARLSAPEPEPVACIVKDCENHKHQGRFVGDLCSPCHAFITRNEGKYSQAYRNVQREWQGLTDEEMSAAMDYWSDPVRSAYGGAHSADGEYVGMIDTWQYIEAKLKEKNT